MTSIDERRRVSFDSTADRYDAARPSYPEALFDDLIALARIRADAVVLEVGAGTGKATLPLARRGIEVIAIEPSANMAAVLRAKVDGLRVAIAGTTFEAYRADRAADVVLSAQAFHWVDPSVRYVKAADVLAPGGALALLRNDKGELDPGLASDLAGAYAEHFADGPGPHSARHERSQIAAEIDASGRFGAVTVRTYPWSATYSAADYIRLLETYSDHAVLKPSRSQPLYRAIARAIERRGGSITIPYVAALHLAEVR
ncbi:MAG TPA: methyltransferase domain-containing protein [Kofleriaceae bacterium]|nr:methyltransferase domain-containing protein [Kofleriaceae bacterium]